MGRLSVLVGTPYGARYIVVATVPGGENGWTQNSGGLGCPWFRTSFGPIPERNHTGIVVIDPGGPSTMSSENGSMGIVGNVPRGTPTQRMSINHRPVGTGVSLNVRCLRSCTTRQQGHYPGSGSAPPPGMVSGTRLKVAGITQ